MRRNPRREAVLLAIDEQLLEEASYYACIMDCPLLIVEMECGGFRLGVVYRVTHRSVDCSKGSYLAETGCMVITTNKAASREVLGSSSDGLLYAARRGDRVAAIYDIEHCDTAERIAGEELARGCSMPRYYCVETLYEIGDMLEED